MTKSRLGVYDLQVLKNNKELQNRLQEDDHLTKKSFDQKCWLKSLIFIFLKMN